MHSIRPARRVLHATLVVCRGLVPCILLIGPAAGRADDGNPRIDYAGFAREVGEVAAIRASRRVDEEAFLRLAAEPGTIILDARSREKYDLLHVRGARNLPLTDVSETELERVIPAKDTPVLIYCNNNFVNEPEAFFAKRITASLNVHTFTVLHAYGYTNVHELKPLLDVRTTRIPFDGTRAATLPRVDIGCGAVATAVTP